MLSSARRKFSRDIHSFQSIKPNGEAPAKPRIERNRGIVNLILYGMILVACYVLPRPHSWQLADRLTQFLGLLAVVVGILGRLWCGLYVFERKTKQLCDIGPYSVCRNPLYLFSFITGMGVAAQTDRIAVMILYGALFCGYYYRVIQSEEKRLARFFGARYTEYCRNVPRIIPKLQRYHTPERIEVHTKVLLVAMVKGVWPVLLIGAIELIQFLKTAGG